MTLKPAILLVDHNAGNVAVLSSFLRESGYRTHGIATLSELDTFLTDAGEDAGISLALVDLSGFDASVWDRCRRMYEMGIAFVVIARTQTADGGRALHRQSLAARAVHTLTKPLRKEQLLTLVRILTGTDD